MPLGRRGVVDALALREDEAVVGVEAELKREGFSGVHLVTMGWEHRISEILDKT